MYYVQMETRTPSDFEKKELETGDRKLLQTLVLEA
jgi:hypothetical protein